MPIAFHCEHCGKKIEAPDSAGGKRGRCPYCKESNYIPAPVTDEDLFDLAPEDDQAERQRKAEVEALRQQERELIAEMTGEVAGAEPVEQRADLKPEDLHHHVVNYCLDLAGSNLPRARTHVAELKKVRRTALAAVDDFISGKALEPALAQVPERLLQGFLARLRDELK